MPTPVAGPPERWTHNAHYHQVMLDAIPAGCAAALDVGCGTGGLTRRLRAAVPQVIGLDRNEPCIQVARSHPDGGGIGYLVGDVADAPLQPGSFDLVTSIAMVHHIDAALALSKMCELLRPGGVLAVVGLARDRSPADFGWAVPATAGTQLHRLADAMRWRRTGGPPSPPHQPPLVWPPPLSYRQMRRLAERLLPGARYRRHVYWRYSLVWTKPAVTPGPAPPR
jgi:SAM-dependent methyltransferase